MRGREIYIVEVDLGSWHEARRHKKRLLAGYIGLALSVISDMFIQHRFKILKGRK